MSEILPLRITRGFGVPISSSGFSQVFTTAPSFGSPFAGPSSSGML